MGPWACISVHWRWTERAKLWDWNPSLGPIYTRDWEPSTAVYCVNFVMASQSGDYPQEDLAKCGYNLNMKVHFLRTSFNNFWLHNWTRYRNLVIFLIFWSNFGYWKSQKAIDFYTLKFLCSFLVIYSQQKRRLLL